ncbi:MAG: glycosyl hydrolase [Acidobacteriota bacterium]|nr:glycosyl hydrolase [Acidobacteriota bacterium]
MGKFHTRFAALLAATVLLASCTAASDDSDAPTESTTNQSSSGTPVLDANELRASIEELGSKPGKDLKPERLAPGLLPPTNKWFSGLVFGEQTQPVFPLPLSFGADSEGLGFGVPDVTTTGKTIMGGYRPSVRVSVPGVDSWQVSAYDEASVTLSAQGASGQVRIAEGSPFVTFTADEAITVGTNIVFSQTDELWTATDGTHTYGAVAEKATISETSVEVEPGGRVTWFVVPSDGDAKALAALADPVQSTSVSYEVGADEVSTTLNYQTADGGQTAYGVLPHQQDGLPKESSALGSYETIFGAMRLYAGNELTWSSPIQQARASLDLADLNGDERAELAAALTADVADAEAYPADTYFGGKALYRDAQLYAIASQLGDRTAADELRTRVTETLLRWTDPAGCTSESAFCFFYDSTNRGIVGQTPSFGSDEFNDHHFHYGYFLYAAGVLGQDDPELVARIAPVMNLLAADIATSVATQDFPVRRNFDVYQSHSWASGTAPFADGNNQESSSEAVHAYAGLTLWAQVSGNSELETQATWMHALEAQAARAYWTDFDKTDPVYDGYQHQISPLVFGGKRDYATWFSAEPAAAMAILVIPASPSSGHLAGDPERIGANVAEATANRGFAQQYGDYLLMYSALQGEPERLAALEEARKLPADLIDDGNTRTYLLAWLHSLKP